MTVGDRIRLLRAAKGLAQTELARKAGVEGVTVNRIETGRRAPRDATLQFLAEALSVKAAALVDDLECFRELARMMGVPAIVGPASAQDEAAILLGRLGPGRAAAAMALVQNLETLLKTENAPVGRPAVRDGRPSKKRRG